MANPVEGEITLSIKVKARSEAAFKRGSSDVAVAVNKSVVSAAKALPTGTDITEAAFVVSNTTSIISPPKPVRATPKKRAVKRTAKKATSRKAVATRKKAAPKKRAAKRAPAKKKAAKRRTIRRG